MRRKILKEIIGDYEPEMSFAEIARELGCSEQNVEEAYYKAMMKLMIRLEVIKSEN